MPTPPRPPPPPPPGPKFRLPFIGKKKLGRLSGSSLRDTNEKESIEKMAFIDKPEIAWHLSPRTILSSAAASSSLVLHSNSEHYDDTHSTLPEVYHDKRGTVKLLSSTTMTGTKKSTTSNKMPPPVCQPLVRSDSRAAQSNRSSDPPQEKVDASERLMALRRERGRNTSWIISKSGIVFWRS